MPLEDFFKPKSKRGFMYNIKDNLIGYDDGRDTPGERLGMALNKIAKNPVQTIMNAGKATVDDLNYLMFQGGAEREPERVFGYAAAPMAPGAASGTLFRRNPNRMNIFAGRNAKTADLDAMKRAEDALARGASRDDVWRDTGWFRGVDGKMRFEIDDSGADLSNFARGGIEENRERSGRIFNMLEHDNAASAYPDMQSEMTVDGGIGAGGSYYPDSGNIAIRAARPSEGRSVALHEVQHGIQGKEGFAQGASPSDMWMAHNQLQRQVEAHLDARSLLQEIRANGGDWDKAISDFQELGMLSPDGIELARRFGSYDVADKAFKEISTAKQKLEPLREVGQWQQDIGYGPYRRVAGEVEARNVQARKDFTPDQRRATPPWATQDVPDEKQILVFGDRLQLSKSQNAHDIADYLKSVGAL